MAKLLCRKCNRIRIDMVSAVKLLHCPLRNELLTQIAQLQLCGNIILKDCVEAGDPRIAYELIL